MAARFHLFPFRTEKLSSLSPMVLNFGRVGSRRFQESISLRLTPFFVSGRSASAQDPAARLGQPPSTDSCPLRRLQSVTVVRGRCVTFGDGKILHPPSSTITSLHLHPQSLAPRQLPAPQATIGDGRPGTMCHLRRRKNPPSSTINHQSSTINLSILFPTFVTI